MICVSITENNSEKVLELIDRFDFCELRLDLIKPDEKDLEKFLSGKAKIIITCRENEEIDRFDILKKALKYSPDYIDIEFETNPEKKGELISLCEKYGVKRIHSYHNFDTTPDYDFLEKISKEEFEKFNPEMIKIATAVKTEKDNITLLSLLKTDLPLVVIGMGEKGKITRVMAPFLGSKFTFAGIDGKYSAPGQIDYDSMLKLYRLIEETIK